MISLSLIAISWMFSVKAEAVHWGDNWQLAPILYPEQYIVTHSTSLSFFFSFEQRFIQTNRNQNRQALNIFK